MRCVFYAQIGLCGFTPWIAHRIWVHARCIGARLLGDPTLPAGAGASPRHLMCLIASCEPVLSGLHRCSFPADGTGTATSNPQHAPLSLKRRKVS